MTTRASLQAAIVVAALASSIIALSAPSRAENTQPSPGPNTVPCRHPSHGVERYQRSFSVTRKSPEFNLSHTHPYYCDGFAGGLAAQYPGSRVTRTNSDVRSRVAPCELSSSSCTYGTYICTFQVEADPVYKLAVGPECR